MTSCLARLVAWNTSRVHRVDPDSSNPRFFDEEWYHIVVADHPVIQAEWGAFIDSGARLPLIDDLLGGWQGNDESWWQPGPSLAGDDHVPRSPTCSPRSWPPS